MELVEMAGEISRLRRDLKLAEMKLSTANKNRNFYEREYNSLKEENDKLKELIPTTNKTTSITTRYWGIGRATKGTRISIRRQPASVPNSTLH